MTIISVANLNDRNILLSDSTKSLGPNQSFLIDKTSIFRVGERYFAFMGSGELHYATEFLINWANYKGYDFNVKSPNDISHILKTAKIFNDILSIIGVQSPFLDSSVFMIDSTDCLYWKINQNNSNWVLNSNNPIDVQQGNYEIHFFGNTPTVNSCSQTFSYLDLENETNKLIHTYRNSPNLPYIPNGKYSIVEVLKTERSHTPLHPHLKIPFSDFVEYLVSMYIEGTPNPNQLIQYALKNAWSPF